MVAQGLCVGRMGVDVGKHAYFVMGNGGISCLLASIFS